MGNDTFFVSLHVMSKKNNKLMRRRLLGAWISTVISISLVLLLVGIGSLLLLNARRVSDYFKENVQVSVLLHQDVTDAEAETCLQQAEAVPGVKSVRLVSREEGVAEMAEMQPNTAAAPAPFPNRAKMPNRPASRPATEATSISA